MTIDDLRAKADINAADWDVEMKTDRDQRKPNPSRHWHKILLVLVLLSLASYFSPSAVFMTGLPAAQPEPPADFMEHFAQQAFEASGWLKSLAMILPIFLLPAGLVCLLWALRKNN